MSYLTNLVCPKCAASYPAGQAHGLCRCGSPLLAAYDLKEAARGFSPRSLVGRPETMWRYREMLPVRNPSNIVTLGEGFTPLVHAQRLGKHLGLDRLYIKD